MEQLAEAMQNYSAIQGFQANQNTYEERAFMIVETRTYRIKPGAMHDFLSNYAAEGLPLQQKALGHLIGYFVSEIGDLNRVIHMWGFESFEDRLKRRAALHSSPEWRAFLSKSGHFVLEQHSELMIPAPFSPIK